MDIVSIALKTVLYGFTVLTAYTLLKHLSVFVMFLKTERVLKDKNKQRPLTFALKVGQYNRLADLQFIDSERRLPVAAVLVPVAFLTLPITHAIVFSIIHMTFLAFVGRSYHIAIALEDKEGIYGIVSPDISGVKKLLTEIDQNKLATQETAPIHHATRGFHLGRFHRKIKQRAEERRNEPEEDTTDAIKTMSMTPEEALNSDFLPDEIKAEIRKKLEVDDDQSSRSDNNVLH